MKSSTCTQSLNICFPEEQTCTPFQVRLPVFNGHDLLTLDHSVQRRTAYLKSLQHFLSAQQYLIWHDYTSLRFLQSIQHSHKSLDISLYTVYNVYYIDNMKDGKGMDDTPVKRCPTCEKWLPATLEYFGYSKHTKDHWRFECKTCRNARRRLAYAEDIQRKGLITPNKRQRIQPEERHQHRLEYNKAYGKVYFSRPDIKEKRRAYKQERLKLPEVQAKARARSTARKARERDVTGTYTSKQLVELLKRQKYACYYCSAKFERKDGKYIYHVDHTFPLSRVAGTDIPANDISYVVLACPGCNLSKGNKYPWEFYQGGKLL